MRLLKRQVPQRTSTMRPRGFKLTLKRVFKTTTSALVCSSPNHSTHKTLVFIWGFILILSSSDFKVCYWDPKQLQKKVINYKFL